MNRLPNRHEQAMIEQYQMSAAITDVIFWLAVWRVMKVNENNWVEELTRWLKVPDRLVIGTGWYLTTVKQVLVCEKAAQLAMHALSLAVGQLSELQNTNHVGRRSECARVLGYYDKWKRYFDETGKGELASANVLPPRAALFTRIGQEELYVGFVGFFARYAATDAIVSNAEFLFLVEKRAGEKMRKLKEQEYLEHCTEYPERFKSYIMPKTKPKVKSG